MDEDDKKVEESGNYRRLRPLSHKKLATVVRRAMKIQKERQKKKEEEGKMGTYNLVKDTANIHTNNQNACIRNLLCILFFK